MCGIFGVVSSDPDAVGRPRLAAMVRRLFLLSESRGREASGLCVEAGGELHVLKCPLTASRFARTSEYRGFVRQTIVDRSEPRFSCIGHCRLVTNGDRSLPGNNQPVAVDGGVGVHNGIVCNHEELWGHNGRPPRESDLDSEVLFRLLAERLESEGDLERKMSDVYSRVEGTCAIAFYPQSQEDLLLLGTNYGSLFVIQQPDRRLLVFASERRILERLQGHRSFHDLLADTPILGLEPNQTGAIDLDRAELTLASNGGAEVEPQPRPGERVHIAPWKPGDSAYGGAGQGIKLVVSDLHRAKLADWEARIAGLRRCTRCILPETHPFITFDADGVCSFCRSYVPKTSYGKEPLFELADRIRSRDGSPDCLVALSGGRDSSYVLHYAKTELGLNPIAYTYDWGLVTDLARRNQARVCGKLGVELIIVAADIQRKRECIRLNVDAWLKKPDLGLIPLFIAGDKMFYSNGNRLRRQTGIKTLMFGMNELENTDFKEGYCGIHRIKAGERFYHASALEQLKMIGYYGKAFATNPSYVNSSLWDTFKAFVAYYLIPHDYFLFFSYMPWDEEEIETTIIGEYNWEVATDTKSTWRIGDGTAAFYNYVYYTVGGFTESDAFRSNQIREGLLDRQRALEIVAEENKIRYASLEWYFNCIGIDPNRAVAIIDEMPRRF